MAKLLQIRRGTTTQHSSFTGAEGEITVDTDKDTIVVHDGSTAGGKTLMSASGGAFTGAITTNSTFDGVDIAARDAIHAPKASPTFTGTVAIPNVADLEAAVVANTAKVTNANPTLADINALDITELGTVTSANFNTIFPFTSQTQNVGKLRIISGTLTTPNSESANWGGGSSGAAFRNLITLNYTGFASTPQVFAMMGGNSYQTNIGSFYQISTTSSNFYVTSGQTGHVQNKSLHYLIIGTAS